ncbi:metal-binding protein [Pseudomonas sp. PDM19]|uniref:metal-binding protein n=1 Tax=Pseudomonas sp. PDM19 TaxID=2769272 RepID=UPI00177CD079|nr:metal-binding protein [Pseudomonas sp. PDM19]MBD9630733.1 metal-binding protein [Pseudomonas sp. PDM19]
MGEFTKRISERVQHTQIEEGYCLICGEYERLTFDHVPPQGCVTITKTEQFHLSEYMDLPSLKMKGVQSNNGSKFKTICRACNNLIGRDDEELSLLIGRVTSEVRREVYNINRFGNVIRFNVDVVKFCRAMVGHILSATSTRECAIPANTSDYFLSLREFVLRNGARTIQDTHDFYCWFYPFKWHISAKMFAMHNNGHQASLSALHFFPIGFLVSEKGKGIYPAQAYKIDLNKNSIDVDLSAANVRLASMPLCELSGDQFIVFQSSQTIVSQPIKS